MLKQSILLLLALVFKGGTSALPLTDRSGAEGRLCSTLLAKSICLRVCNAAAFHGNFHEFFPNVPKFVL